MQELTLPCPWFLLRVSPSKGHCAVYRRHTCPGVWWPARRKASGLRPLKKRRRKGTEHRNLNYTRVHSRVLACTLRYQSKALLCTFSIVNTAMRTIQIGLQRTVVMAGSGSPSSGREPLKQSKYRKAAEGDEHGEENNATKRFKETQAAKGLETASKEENNWWTFCG